MSDIFQSWPVERSLVALLPNGAGGPTASRALLQMTIASRAIGQRFFFFLESRVYTKRELHHVLVGNLSGGRRRAEALRRHFAHILVFVLA